MKIEAYYSDEITYYSKKELEKFVDWINKNKIEPPYVIGGWAVYAYGSSYGSLDIESWLQMREVNLSSQKLCTILKSMNNKGILDCDGEYYFISKHWFEKIEVLYAMLVRVFRS